MTNKYLWKIPPKKINLFMGASHILNDIDDNLLENAMNIAGDSERYIFSYLKLKKILDNKENKIEHIILQCAPTDLSQVADYKIYNTNGEMLFFIPLYYPLFRKDEWNVYSKYITDIIKIITPRFYYNWAISSNKHFYKYGHYLPENNIFDVNAFVEEKTELIDAEYYGNSVNYLYLRKIIKICQQNNIKLTFLYCPMYKPELFYDQQYYYNALERHFGNIDLWDYSHFDIPIEYFKDAHHLNEVGAKYFTSILKEEKLK
jgi:hypothetical protein